MSVEAPQGRQRVWKLLGTATQTGIGTVTIYTLPAIPKGLTAVVMSIFMDVDTVGGGGIVLHFHKDDIATAIGTPVKATHLAEFTIASTQHHDTDLSMGLVEPGGGFAMETTHASDSVTCHIFGFEEEASNA